MSNVRRAVCLVFGVAIAFSSSEAAAYHPVPGFQLEATEGGASGFYFTGAPRWLGQDCGVCHIDAPMEVRFHLTSTPEDIFTTQRYEPGATYRITIDVSGAEGRGLRTWMLETADEFDRNVGDYRDVPLGCESAQGQLRSCLQPSCNFICKNRPGVKDWCAPDGQSICSQLVTIDGCEQCGGGDGCAGCVTIHEVVGGVVVVPPWQMDFIAPPAGTGPITMYFGGVAGTSDHTSLEDDYEMQTHRLCEGSADCIEDPSSSSETEGDYEPESHPAGGCSTGHGGAPAWWLCVVALVVLGGARRYHA